MFSMGGRIGVLQLANILHKLHEEHQTSQGYVPDKLLVEKFEAAFNDLLEKVTYAEGARLYDKYKCVLAAATHGWDFSQAKRYIYEDCTDPNVEADVKVIKRCVSMTLKPHATQGGANIALPRSLGITA